MGTVKAGRPAVIVAPRRGRSACRKLAEITSGIPGSSGTGAGSPPPTDQDDNSRRPEAVHSGRAGAGGCDAPRPSEREGPVCRV